MSDDELRAALLAKMRAMKAAGQHIPMAKVSPGGKPSKRSVTIEVMAEIDPDAPVVEGELQ
ncbi:MAG: hypothetical protein IPK85_03160 [Gemmatimonadetes bacterium]|nr:hypothetical protein [Gemmatimonadota bacterium]